MLVLFPLDWRIKNLQSERCDGEGWLEGARKLMNTGGAVTEVFPQAFDKIKVKFCFRFIKPGGGLFTSFIIQKVLLLQLFFAVFGKFFFYFFFSANRRTLSDEHQMLGGRFTSLSAARLQPIFGERKFGVGWLENFTKTRLQYSEKEINVN